MCIYYSETQTKRQKARKSKEFTAYKVYKVRKPYMDSLGRSLIGPVCLLSPHFSSSVGGKITRAGEYTAHNPWVDYKAFGSHDGSQSKLDSISHRNIHKYEGASINCAGFHCFLDKKDAQKYASRDDCVVVPVQVRTKDLIIAGKEPVSATSSGKARYGRTATFKKITITDKAFQEAVGK